MSILRRSAAGGRIAGDGQHDFSPDGRVRAGEGRRWAAIAERPLIELVQRRHVVYVLDEPRTGLPLDDVAGLVAVRHRLVDSGHT